MKLDRLNDRAESPAGPAPAFASLLEPFAKLHDTKRDVLREVLQIYVSKDSGKFTELEKRKRLTALINDHVKGAAESKSSRHGKALGRAVTRGLARVGPCRCGSLPPAVCGHAHMRPVYTAPRV
jgi:hypothetical protein